MPIQNDYPTWNPLLTTLHPIILGTGAVFSKFQHWSHKHRLHSCTVKQLKAELMMCQFVEHLPCS